MDGFKTLPKMAHFKSGGHAKKEEYCGGGKTYKDGGDVAQDKAMIKKAFKQHDRAEHDKEPTEIKLKKGGRSKKEKGTVTKFKDGSAVYGAKKDATDNKEIAAVKKEKPKMLKSGGSTGVSDVEKEKSKPAGDKVPTIKVKPTGDKKAAAPSKASVKPFFGGSDVEKEKSKPVGDAVSLVKVKPTGDKKAAAPSKAVVKPSRLDDMVAPDDLGTFKKGGKLKKFADGRLTGALTNQDRILADSELERRKRIEKGMQSLSPDMARQLLQQMPPEQYQQTPSAPMPNAPMPSGPQPGMGAQPIPNAPMSGPGAGFQGMQRL